MRALVTAMWVWMQMGAVWAWNGEGHRMVAEMAAARLSSATRADIEQLYGQPAEQVLQLLSTWADGIATARPETRPWHYVNIPLRADGFDRARDCPSSGCVISALETQWARWRDPLSEPSGRREALQWLIHLVADMHQPLHCGDGGDRGGNDIAVEIDGVRTNLHRIWDGEFFPWRLFEGGPPDTEGELLPATFVDWANESHGLAVHEIYPLPAPGPDRVVRLTPSYLDSYWRLAQSRINLAAARLAAVLNAR